MTLKERLINKPMPVGFSEFKEIYDRNLYYADKTLLIKNLLEESAQVMLFTRPRRFGKTLNMTMLRTFFEKPMDGKDTSHYFKDLKIWHAGEQFKAEQGKRPVIYITFKDIKWSDFKRTFEEITKVIGFEYRRHSELEDSPNLQQYEKEIYQSISMEKAPEKDWRTAIFSLSVMLEKHHGIKPVILIDEYDVPIQAGFDHDFYPQIIEFMRSFLSAAFKDNPSLFMGVITGVSRVSKESLFSGLNNLSVNTIFDEEFSEYFGITPDEVKQMLEFYGVPEKYSEVKHWYDGYIFGKREMYNPWSLINYMARKCDPQDYWTGTSSNAMLWELIESMDTEDKKTLQSLLKGEKINADVNMNIVYPEIMQDSASAYGLLVQTGYLKAGNSYFDDGFYNAELTIPNKEIQAVYAKQVIRHIKNIPAKKSATGIHMAMVACNTDRMQRELNNFLQFSCSYLDLTEEKDYQNLMVGLLSAMRYLYEIKSNREAGTGRADILLRPRANMEKAKKCPA
ncbi:MAG: AAA family ATPase [Elusimicrobiales bacterium]|nr:AAA family ATPase [Elusimicrobiales bacterium]